MDIESTASLLSWQPPKIKQIIEEGLLYPGGRLLIFGKYGSWKSMVAIHTAFVLAKGEDWFRYKTIRSKVMAVQIEVPKFAFQERIMSYLENNHYKDNTVPNLYWVNEPIIKLDTPLQAKLLEREIDRLKPDVLILDPLYKTFTHNAADNVDVQRWQESVDHLASKYKLGIIVLAHPKKQAQGLDEKDIDWGDELFGGSFFNNWFDTAILIRHSYSGPVHKLNFTFTKNPRNAKRTQLPFDIEVNENDLVFRIPIPSKEGISVKTDTQKSNNTT